LLSAQPGGGESSSQKGGNPRQPKEGGEERKLIIVVGEAKATAPDEQNQLRRIERAPFWGRKKFGPEKQAQLP